MLIDRIETLPLRIPFRASGTGAGAARALHLVLCRVTTRSGVIGYGEALCYLPAFQNQLVASIRDVIAPLYLGRDVADREALNQANRRSLASFGRAGVNLNAMAAVDIALWDIAGKAAGTSLSALLGASNPAAVPVMASLDQHGPAGELADLVGAALAARVAAVKLHDDRLDVVERLAELTGGVPLALDTNNRWTRDQMTAHAARLADLKLRWLEDPIWPPEALLDSPRLPGTPIATGADLGSAEQHATYARHPAVDIVQPDVCLIGGVSEMVRAIRLLSPLGVEIVPHTPFVGPAGLATLHLMAALTPGAPYAVIEADPEMDICGAGLTAWKPELTVPPGPGLGLDPDPALLKAFALQ